LRVLAHTVVGILIVLPDDIGVDVAIISRLIQQTEPKKARVVGISLGIELDRVSCLGWVGSKLIPVDVVSVVRRGRMLLSVLRTRRSMRICRWWL